MFSYDYKDEDPLEQRIKNFKEYEEKFATKLLRYIGSMLSSIDKLMAYPVVEEEIRAIPDLILMLYPILRDLQVLHPDQKFVNNVQAAIVKRDNELKNFLRNLGDNFTDESKYTPAEIQKERRIEFKHERSEEETNAIIAITQNLAAQTEEYNSTRKKYRAKLHHYMDILVESSEQFKQSNNIDKESDCFKENKWMSEKSRIIGFSL